MTGNEAYESLEKVRVELGFVTDSVKGMFVRLGELYAPADEEYFDALIAGYQSITWRVLDSFDEALASLKSQQAGQILTNEQETRGKRA